MHGPSGMQPRWKKQRPSVEECGEGGASSAAAAQAEDSCALCLRSSGETDEKSLRASHGCGTCRAGSWAICEDCHLSLLSRDCPICRSPYQALELFAMPSSLPPLTQLDSCVLLAVVRQSPVGVCVWEPAVRRASFMLAPADPGASGRAGQHVAVAGVDLSNHTFGATQGDGNPPRFLFDTTLWAAIERDDEEQDDEDDKIEMVNAGTCARMLVVLASLRVRKRAGACLSATELFSAARAPGKVGEWIAALCSRARPPAPGAVGGVGSGGDKGRHTHQGNSNCQLLTPLRPADVEAITDLCKRELPFGCDQNTPQITPRVGGTKHARPDEDAGATQDRKSRQCVEARMTRSMTRS